MTALAEPLMIGSADYAEVAGFLYREARLLDSYDYLTWLTMLDRGLTYRMPIRLSRMPKDGDGFVKEMEYFSENYSSINTRIVRLQTDQAWAEQPASRTRHFVTNVTAERLGTGDVEVVSAFLVTRTRADMPYDIFTGERIDLLRRGDDGALRLFKRDIRFDQTVLKAMNLSIFF